MPASIFRVMVMEDLAIQAQKEGHGPRDTFAEQLQNSGYSREEVRRMMDVLHLLRSGAGRFGPEQLEGCMRMGGTEFEGDIWRMMQRWNEIAMDKVTLSELTVDEVKRITKNTKGPGKELKKKIKAPALHLQGGAEIRPEAAQILHDMYEALVTRKK